ncbi:MAG: glycosyltransferase family 9 protein [Saprospiraceae bacterium]
MGKDFQNRNIKSQKFLNAAIFLTAGIGDAVLMVPLLKELKSSGYLITIFLNSPYIDKEFLEFNRFPYNEIKILTYPLNLTNILRNYKKYNLILLDYSSSSVKNIFLASLISKKVNAHSKKKLPFFNVHYLDENENTHCAILNLQLLDSKKNDMSFSLDQINIKPYFENTPDCIRKIKNEGKKPIIVQPVSANNIVKYKNWSHYNWIDFLRKLSKEYPEFHFILIGDKNEITIGNEINNEIEVNITNMIGKTSLKEACSILYHSQFYIGLDSGFMHLAVAYGIPTFSIFGASSVEFVGYEKFDNLIHKVIYNPLYCWPCHGFSQTNKSKVTNPKNCEDISCIRGISVDNAYNNFVEYIKILKILTLMR